MTDREPKPDIPLGGLFSIIHRTHLLIMNHQLRPLKITASQLPVIMYLNKHQGITQDTLTQVFHLDKGTIARTIKKLEDGGFVNRLPNPENRRAVCLFLTNKGREITSKIPELETKWQEEITLELSDSEKELLIPVIKKIAGQSITIVKELEEISDGTE